MKTFKNFIAEQTMHEQASIMDAVLAALIPIAKTKDFRNHLVISAGLLSPKITPDMLTFGMTIDDGYPTDWEYYRSRFEAALKKAGIHTKLYGRTIYGEQIRRKGDTIRKVKVVISTGEVTTWRGKWVINANGPEIETPWDSTSMYRASGY